MPHTEYHPFMHEAIRLAKNAQWKTAPNPAVGAVLVQDGVVVAHGWHKGVGTAHAEVAALEDAEKQGVDPSKCKLIVTLEPCKHHGKTPPCVDAILRARIPHVIIGALDPNPLASGGAEILRAQGVRVDEGIAEAECLDLIDDFITWQTTDLPYVILKLASTLDGRIATRTGHSQWITSPETRQEVQKLRRSMQAIIVGSNTFYQDDPKLTARTDEDALLPQQPLAIVVTSRLPDAGTTHYLLRERPTETIFWTTVAAAASPKAETLRRAGARVLGLPSSPRSDKTSKVRAELSLHEGLVHLRKELNCHYVLCEGGGRLGLALLDKGFARELHLHLAPKILGDADATPLFAGKAPTLMDDALQFRITETQISASDILLTMRPNYPADKRGQ